jgi:hypothetical protein
MALLTETIPVERVPRGAGPVAAGVALDADGLTGSTSLLIYRWQTAG